MKNIKIYTVLEGFTSVEQNRFLKFCHSSYFNANDELSNFADILIKTIRENKKLNSSTIDRELLYIEAFKKTEFNDQDFRTKCSKLQSLLEEYLCYNEFENDKLAKNIYLLNALHKKNLEILSKKVKERSKRDLNRNLEKSSDFYLKNYQYQLAVYKRSSEFNKKIISKDPLKTRNIHAINENLDKFYLLSKLRYINELVTYKYLYKLDIDLSEFDYIEQKLIEKNYLENPTIELYYLLCKILIDEKSASRYFELVDKTMIHLDKYNDFEQKEIFNSLFNYTIKKVNQGEHKFYEEILKLYEIGIDLNIILVKGNISPTSFRNVVITAIRLDKISYAKSFILNNQHLLEDHEKENAINFSFARIAMHESNWRDAIEYISQVDFEDESYNLTSRLIMLNAYYELEEMDPLESLIESTAAFIRRKETISESRKIAFLNHLRYLRKLVKLTKYDKEKLANLLKELKNNPRITNRDWLIKKVEEIIS